MSRIGKQPVAVPQGVRVHATDGTVRVEGPRGTLERRLDPEVSVAVEGGAVVVRRRDDSRRARSIHGLTRKLIGNMVDGVNKGFTRVLEINGVGYRAEARGTVLYLTLGYSHPIAFQLPPGISAKVDRDARRTRSRASWTYPGGHPRAPATRAVQGQGGQVRGRDDPP